MLSLIFPKVSDCFMIASFYCLLGVIMDGHQLSHLILSWAHPEYLVSSSAPFFFFYFFFFAFDLSNMASCFLFTKANMESHQTRPRHLVVVSPPFGHLLFFYLYYKRKNLVYNIYSSFQDGETTPWSCEHLNINAQ